MLLGKLRRMHECRTEKRGVVLGSLKVLHCIIQGMQSNQFFALHDCSLQLDRSLIMTFECRSQCRASQTLILRQ